MGLRKRFLVLFMVMLSTVGIILFVVLNESHENLVEDEVSRFGKIVTNQVLAERLAYSKIVEKLQKEGFGASRVSHEVEGFIPLPAQYIRSISQQIGEHTDMYSYSLISEWNINQEQGLKEEFDHWAWKKLKEQELQFKARLGDTGKAYPWRTVQRVEEEDGQHVLKMMTVDPASSPSCVDCHNKLELTPDIISMREKKQFSIEKTMEAA